MICPKCGATIEGGYRYVTCPNCGRTFDSTQLENVEEPAPKLAPTSESETVTMSEPAPAPEHELEPAFETENTPAPEPAHVPEPTPAPQTAPEPKPTPFQDARAESEQVSTPESTPKPLVQTNSYKNDKQVSFPAKLLVSDTNKESPLKSSFSLNYILIVVIASFIALFFSIATPYLLDSTIFGGFIYPVAIYFPALCIGFFLGPLYSVLVIIVKVLITYLLSITLYQLIPYFDFYMLPYFYEYHYYLYPLFELLLGCLYVIPVSVIYWKTKNMKGYTFGVVIAIVIEMILYLVLPYPVFASNTFEPYLFIMIKGILDSSIALLLFKWISNNKKFGVKD